METEERVGVFERDRVDRCVLGVCCLAAAVGSSWFDYRSGQETRYADAAFAVLQHDTVPCGQRRARACTNKAEHIASKGFAVLVMSSSGGKATGIVLGAAAGGADQFTCA
jgi:hypothetical protein